MIILKVKCGFGNQIFQYALYRKLKQLGKKVKLDATPFIFGKYHSGYELSKVFGVGLKKEQFTLIDLIKWKIKRVFCRKKAQIYWEDENRFNDEIFEMDNVTLKGYWQNLEYFQDIEDELRKELTFKKTLDARNQNILRDISNTQSVSIHIRRGNYLNGIFDVCNLDYYSKAIGYVNSKVEDPTYYVFSNDPQWCKENIKAINIVYISHNTGKNSYKDFQLMAHCQHNIIANSTFSWWAAWLNSNPEKMVITPYIWGTEGALKEKAKVLTPKNWVIIKF